MCLLGLGQCIHPGTGEPACKLRPLLHTLPTFALHPIFLDDQDGLPQLRSTRQEITSPLIINRRLER